MPFDRRAFLQTSVSAGALALLPRCTVDQPPGEGEPGSFTNPWTEDAPGPNAAEAKYAAPQIYGALVDDKIVRLWVECTDPAAAAAHPMEQDHFVEELYLYDDFGNEIASLAFRYDQQARLIASVEIPDRVTRIDAYSKCSKTGYWRRSVAIEDLRIAPLGDLQRPYTVGQPGDMNAPKHVPILGRRPDGSYAVEVGDRAGGNLHEMTQQHYIQHVAVFDEYHQLRTNQPLSYQVPEPVVENVFVAGAKKVRVVALCNLHFYWEAVYEVAG